MTASSGDASGQLDRLLALTGCELPSVRVAIGKLDRTDADEVLHAAVLRLASLDAAASLTTTAEESPAEPAEELPVEDPWVDPERPHSSTLDGARLLRVAVLDQPTLEKTLTALGALTAQERELILIELAVDAFWTRSQQQDAGAER
jgi:ribosomal protein L12E/L44/L45/RPP1/RPP2